MSNPLSPLVTAPRKLGVIFLRPLHVLSAPVLHGSRLNAWRANQTRRATWAAVRGAPGDDTTDGRDATT